MFCRPLTAEQDRCCSRTGFPDPESSKTQGLRSEIPVLHRTPAAPQDTAPSVIRRRNALRDVRTSPEPVHVELVGESGGASHQLLGMVGHFASDGHSTRILHADLEALLRGREPAPPPLSGNCGGSGAGNPAGSATPTGTPAGW